VSKQKIVIAEDDPISLLFTKSLLEDRGYAVVTAADGEEALAAVRREIPDLLVTDMVMPYKSGLELIREMRRDPELALIPVIIVSMKDKEADIVQGLEEGADDYIVKPVHAMELAARVRKILDRVPVKLT
jgi:DNA-binding response OmpR family regulator